MKDIPGYEGLYAVTEDGKVWSYPKRWVCGKTTSFKHDGRYLAIHEHTGGYLQVGLSKSKKTRNRFVHRLVALTYLDNPECKKEVNHKDGNKKNNRYTNLEWSTRRENASHAQALGLYKHEPARGSKHPDAKINEADVLRIRQLRNEGYSIRQLMELYPLSESSMYSVCNRQSWTHI